MAVNAEQAPISYLKWQEIYQKEKPFQLFFNIPANAPDQRQTNMEFEEKTCVVKDVRGRESEFDLDIQGFKICRHQSDFGQFTDAESVTNHYMPEIEQLIKTEVEGADRVIIFDHRVRLYQPPSEVQGQRIDLNDKSAPLQPSPFVHCDQSSMGALNKVLSHAESEPDEYLHGRMRILNVWHPLVPTVWDWPLALCDARSVHENDLIECDSIRQTYSTSAIFAVNRPTHQWHYLSKQARDEVIIHKQFDSADNVAKRCPHCAFHVQDPPPNGLPRESIEFRAIVFTSKPE